MPKAAHIHTHRINILTSIISYTFGLSFCLPFYIEFSINMGFPILWIKLQLLVVGCSFRVVLSTPAGCRELSVAPSPTPAPSLPAYSLISLGIVSYSFPVSSCGRWSHGDCFSSLPSVRSHLFSGFTLHWNRLTVFTDTEFFDHNSPVWVQVIELGRHNRTLSSYKLQVSSHFLEL